MPVSQITNRQELWQLLDELAQLYPDMRLGQLIANASYWAKGPTPSALWDVKDDELKRAIEEHLQKHKAL